MFLGRLDGWLCRLFFFFFQAEDGIRDVAVTGVQTCALPICLANRFIPFIANCTCGVGRRVFRSSSKRVARRDSRSEEHTSELQSRLHLVCRLLLEKKKKKKTSSTFTSR